MRILHRLGQLPMGARILLFGTGQAGRNMLSLLLRFRPDLGIIGFLDSFRSGRYRGYPVFNLAASLPEGASAAQCLLTTMFWREVQGHLADSQIEDLWLIPPRFLFSSALDKLVKQQDKTAPSENTLAPELFDDNSRKQFREDLLRAESLLHAPEGRELFRILTGPDRLNQIGEYYFNSASRGQYKDYLHFDRIGTVIDGGVADGREVLDFLNHMVGPRRIFGFEPEFENYSSGPYRDEIETHDSVRVFPLGLWSAPGTMHFRSHGRASSLVGKKVVGRIVQTTTVDGFVQENALGKVDLVKLDIEGAELEALKGAENTLKTSRPQLAICIYHKKEHFFQIPLFLDSILADYRYHIGHYTAGTLETVWYGIPRELLGPGM